jgi:hypothetical protein
MSISMEESDTYLAIREIGEIIQAKESVLIVGQHFVGTPDDASRCQILTITDLERLDRMILRALEGANWVEILQTP